VQAEHTITADARIAEVGGKLQLLQQQMQDLPPHVMSSAHALVQSKFAGTETHGNNTRNP